jgi:predicted RNase H-like HicB family nuclease
MVIEAIIFCGLMRFVSKFTQADTIAELHTNMEEVLNLYLSEPHMQNLKKHKVQILN